MQQQNTRKAPDGGTSAVAGDAPHRRREPRGATNLGTAVITGASSGIGAAFARHLAARGYDLLLIARRHDRLATLAASLCEHYNVAAEIMAADLADPAAISHVVEQLGHLNAPRVLVNNAGFGTVGLFTEVDVGTHVAMIDVHILASIRLTHALLPTMLAQGSGAIINVSSIGAFLPTPGNVTYGATKAYLLSFSRALAEELRGTGVRVQALVPGFTRTEFYETPEYARFDPGQIPGALFMTTDQVVQASLRALAKGRVVYIPGVQNRAFAALAQVPIFTRVLLSQYRHLAQMLS